MCPSLVPMAPHCPPFITLEGGGGLRTRLFVTNHCLKLLTLLSPVMAPLSLLRCPYLHRTAGDTERRYHLRYYKTSTCVYETDTRGYCVKNGPHCAFAHGPHDLRPPVYDIRELQGGDEEDRLMSPLVGSLEKERGVLVDDPRWQDMTCRCDSFIVKKFFVCLYRTFSLLTRITRIKA